MLCFYSRHEERKRVIVKWVVTIWRVFFVIFIIIFFFLWASPLHLKKKGKKKSLKLSLWILFLRILLLLCYNNS